MAPVLRPGDPIIYRKTKDSTSPGPRAEAIVPAPHGESYKYYVRKFWRVKEVRPDGKVVVSTRRGKEHVCDPADRNLWKPSIWTRVWYRDYFPPIE